MNYKVYEMTTIVVDHQNTQIGRLHAQKLDENFIFLKGLWIHEDFRNQRIASRLFSAMLDLKQFEDIRCFGGYARAKGTLTQEQLEKFYKKFNAVAADPTHYPIPAEMLKPSDYQGKFMVIQRPSAFWRHIEKTTIEVNGWPAWKRY